MGDISLRLIYGFRYGASDSDGIGFAAFIAEEKMFSFNKTYSTQLSEINFDLRKYMGKSINISLSVDSIGNNAYGWAIWVPSLS